MDPVPLVKLTTIRAGTSMRAFTTGELVAQLPQSFIPAFGWLLFREDCYAAPTGAAGGFYEVVTPTERFGPFSRDMIGDMIRLRWVVPDADDPHRCRGNLAEIETTQYADIKRYIPRPDRPHRPKPPRKT